MGNLKKQRQFYSTSTLHNTIFVIGGISGQDSFLNTIEIIHTDEENPELVKVELMKSKMKEHRAYHSSLVLD